MLALSPWCEQPLLLRRPRSPPNTCVLVKLGRTALKARPCAGLDASRRRALRTEPRGQGPLPPVLGPPSALPLVLGLPAPGHPPIPSAGLPRPRTFPWTFSQTLPIPGHPPHASPSQNTFRTPVYTTSTRRNAMGVGLVFEADLFTTRHISHWVLQGVCLTLNSD